MFNSVKKAISGLFGVRAVAKPRRNVIALPVEAPSNEEALVDARRGLLATLEAILQGKKDAEEEAIDNLLDALHEGFCESDYSAEALQGYLAQLGLVAPDWGSDDERWDALAAAIEYAAGCFPVDVQAIEFALRLVSSGNYIHLPDAEDDETLGMVIASEKFNCNNERWVYLEAFFDFAACGRDYRTAYSGHCAYSKYGFFAEL